MGDSSASPKGLAAVETVDAGSHWSKLYALTLASYWSEGVGTVGSTDQARLSRERAVEKERNLLQADGIDSLSLPNP
jgi:hypothetical protein